MAAVPVPLAIHARMLEERPTGAAGEAILVEQAIALVESGQFVNVRFADYVRFADSEPFVGPLTSPAGLIEGRCAAEVLSISDHRNELVVQVEAPLQGRDDMRALVDFTDASGTYFLSCQVVALRHGARPCVVLRARQARLVQLRRFVRVPVVILPDLIEFQAAPGQWRRASGQIVDISLGGVGMVVTEPLSAETRVRLQFSLPGRFGSLTLTGRIVTPPGPAEARNGVQHTRRAVYRRGVAFDPLTTEDLRRLQRALYHRQVELRRLSDSGARRRPVEPLMPAAPPDPMPRLRWRFWVRR